MAPNPTHAKVLWKGSRSCYKFLFDYIKELGLLAGSVEILSNGEIKLTTRSNFCNSKTCLYNDETLLLAMRHCFLPLDATHEQLNTILQQMSKKKLDRNGAFCLFMTDLLCQLALEVSVVIHAAIRQDLSPSQHKNTNLN